jgi:hypothetical protein
MSNLTGTFIANTYQKLLQYDNINGSVGTTAQFNIADAISSSKYNLLNGLGQTMPGFVIDTTGNGNGGLMFKDSNSDPGSLLFNLGGLWSIQTFETSNSEGGLNFRRPSGVTYPNNAKLFLKNTGSVWVGYQGSGNPVIPTDVATYSLYVKDGIQVGQNTAGNNGRINLIGANPLENGAGMFINNQHPFLIYRFSHGDVGTNETTKRLKINGQDVSVTDWSAMVVGIQINHTGSQTYRQIDDWRCICVDDNGFWAVNLKYDLDGGDTQEFPRIDILFIKKGLYNDFRNSIVNIT